VEVFRGADGIGDVVSIVFSPNGKQILATTRPGNIRVLNIDGGKKGFTIQGREILAASYTGDGSRMLTVGAKGIVEERDARTGAPLGVLFDLEIRKSEQPFAVFSKNGDTLALRVDSRNLRLYPVYFERIVEAATTEVDQGFNQDKDCKMYFDSPQCPDEVGAFELIARGNAAWRDGKRAEAIANYEEARWRDPTLPSGLVFGLRSRIAEGLFVEARAQIRAGKFKDGLSSLKEAERMDQTLVPRPGAESLALSLARQAEIETNHAYAAFFHLRGTLQAKRGDIEDATRSLV